MAPLPTLEPSISSQDTIAGHPLSSPSPPLSNPSIITQLVSLARRQNSPAIIPTGYGDLDSTTSPGTVAGIVLGSVAGFLLVLWLIYTCLNFNTVNNRSEYTESVVVRERRKSRRGSHRRETVEIRRDRSPVRVREESRRPPETVIVEERVERSRERSRGGSDEVVVIEEHSPPRRAKSKRSSRGSRRDSGYRTVDPLAYGGTVGGRSSGGRSRG